MSVFHLRFTTAPSKKMATDLRSELLRLEDGVELTVGRQGPKGDTLTSVVTLEEDGSFWVHDIDTDNIYVGWDVECVMKHMNAGGYTVSSLTVF